jgi:hypothetical protein
VFDLAWIGAVIAFFLPLVTSMLKRQSWSTKTKQVFALGIAVVVGVVNAGLQAEWVFDSASQFVSLAAFSVIDIYIIAAVVYNNFWEGTTVETKLADVGS